MEEWGPVLLAHVIHISEERGRVLAESRRRVVGRSAQVGESAGRRHRCVKHQILGRDGTRGCDGGKGIGLVAQLAEIERRTHAGMNAGRGEPEEVVVGEVWSGHIAAGCQDVLFRFLECRDIKVSGVESGSGRVVVRRV